MRWASAISETSNLRDAVAEVRDGLLGPLDGARPDLAIAFASPHYASASDELPGLVSELLGCETLLGCSALGVIGGGRELEFVPGLSLTVASLPGVTVTPFHVEGESLPDLDGAPGAWIDLIGVAPQPTPHFLLCADPYSIDPRDLLMGLDFAYPAATKLGGLASADANVLFVGDRVHRGGLAGIALAGDVAVEPIVAQGCRPLGEPMTVTGAKQNLILTLNDQRPTDVLGRLYAQLDSAEQDRFRQSLHIGVAPSALTDEPEYLIRNVIGLDSRQGILAIGASVRAGQRVQFHVRDAQAAEDELAVLLEAYHDTHPHTAGALLFACSGRGSGFYGGPDRESELLRQTLGAVPVSGFFCGGELGPVGGSSHLLGYTSSLALVRAGSASAG